MLFMNEINFTHISTLKNIFGDKANIYHSDYLNMTDIEVDIIISNPPYNYGIVKTPTNNNVSKKMMEILYGKNSLKKWFIN